MRAGAGALEVSMLPNSPLRSSLGLLAVVVLSGCTNGVRIIGDWAGDCVLSTPSGARRVPYEIQVTSQWKGELLGTGAYVYDGYVFEGDLRGAVEGRDVGFDLVGIYGGYTVTLEASGSVQDTLDIEGDCVFFDLEGEFDMERRDDEAADLDELATGGSR